MQLLLALLYERSVVLGRSSNINRHCLILDRLCFINFNLLLWRFLNWFGWRRWPVIMLIFRVCFIRYIKRTNYFRW